MLGEEIGLGCISEAMSTISFWLSLDTEGDVPIGELPFFLTTRLRKRLSNLEAISSKARGDSPFLSKEYFTRHRRRSKHSTRYPILTLIPIRTSSCSFGLAIFNGSSSEATKSES